MGNMIEIEAKDGARIGAYRAEPEGPVRGGLVIAQEIFGVNSHIRSVCDGFAADGYLAIAPALFDRYETNVDIGYDADAVNRGRALKAHATTDAALLDVAAAREAVKSAGRIGVIGYCWGGFIAWMAAAKVEPLACAVTYSGGGMTDAVDAKPRCPVLSHFGERDSGIPLSGVERLKAAHPEMELFTYPAEHGFNCDQRHSYDAPSARLARERTLAFLRQHLG